MDIQSEIWFVLKKEAGTKHPSFDESQKLYYGRVIPVSIDPEGVMSCICGKMQKYLMTCTDMCAVLEEKKSIMFQICLV